MAKNSTVEKLLAEAREDYKRAQSPQNKAAARMQRVEARINGNAAAGAAHGRR
ncbi:hypothetical protein [Streptomyces atacamensis]|uniref:hypothetical protein n=1 Tax=Streptomyces atacamensis TaxID=531966 RepID=UPI00399D52E3